MCVSSPSLALLALLAAALLCTCHARSYWDDARFGGEEQDDSQRVLTKRSRVRLCGVQLVETIKLVCRGVAARRGKRAIADDEGEYPLQRSDFDRPYGAESGAAASWGWGAEEGAGAADRFHTVAAVQSVVKRGAADRCCARSCTLAHLATYC